MVYCLKALNRYGNEKSFGVALQESGVDRSKLFITSKVSPSVDNVRGKLQEQLKELKCDYVDLYLIHDPSAAEKKNTTNAEVWKQMEAVKAEGLAKCAFATRDLF